MRVPVVTDDDVCAVTLCVTAMWMRSPREQRSMQFAMMLSSIRWMSAVSSAHSDRRFRNVHVEHDAVVVGDRLYVFQQHPAFRAEVTQLRCECERPSLSPEAVEALSAKRSSR